MRVEFRRRPAKGAQEPLKRPASASPSLVKAYSDSCFESPTSFYIASPEHPKLGKWAQPSTLKYILPPQHHTTHNTTRRVDDAVLSSNHGRPHTTGRQPIRERNKCKAVLFENRSRPKASQDSLKEPPERAKRPASPVGSLLVGCSDSCPSSSIRGRREAPQIDTLVSGRVAPLHQRSNQTSTLPSSPTLCGSFDRQYHPRVRSAGIVRATQPAVTFDWSIAAVDPGVSHQAPTRVDSRGMDFNHSYIEREAVGALLQSGHEDEQVGVPDVRYRVKKLDEVSLGGKDGNPHGGAAPDATGCEDGRRLAANQANILALTPSGSEPPRPGTSNLAGMEKHLLAESTACKEGALGVGANKTDPWIELQFEPFMSALRQALLRDRPIDVPAYALTFSEGWRRE